MPVHSSSFFNVASPSLLCILALSLMYFSPVASANEAAHLDTSSSKVQIGDYEFKYTLSTSVWTTHFNPRPEHNNTQYLISLERHGDNFVSRPLQERFEGLQSADPILGVAHFQNSFAQSTIYAYAGFTAPVRSYGAWHVRGKVSAGFIHGYRNEFQYKVPFNSFGTSPAAIPSVTLHYRQFNSELILFGSSGIMLNLGISF